MRHGYSSLHVTVDHDKPSDFLFGCDPVSQLDQSGPGGALYADAPNVVDVNAQLDLGDLIAYVSVRLVLGRQVGGVVLLDEVEVRQVGELFWIHLLEILGQLGGGGRCHEPLAGAVSEVLDDDVDADGEARPAEAMDEPGGHGHGWARWVCREAARKAGGPGL